MLDTSRAREVFEASEDFTVGIEEEFAILDPGELSLIARFEELARAAASDEVLADSVAGELISSEIEIRSGKAPDIAAALALQQDARTSLLRLAAEHDVRLGATGVHPWSPWQEQHIIETEHYLRLDRDLGYVAWRNNTFSLHVHVGVRDADRAIAVCDRMRPLLPELLALSANSPIVEGRDSRLHSARSQVFTRMFPRCGVPDAFGSFAAYADYVDFLVETRSVVEQTQLWWSVRPHHRFGTVEVRIADAQTTAEESNALIGLIVACAAQAAVEHDEGSSPPPPPGRLIEENLWRALRYGLDGKMIDLERREEFAAAALGDRLLAWTAPARAMLGIEPALPEHNGAQRQRRALADGVSIADVYAAEVAQTQRTYARQEVRT